MSLKVAIGTKIYQIITPSITLLALTLNPICFVVYSGKAFSKTSTAFYLRVLSITDTIALVPCLIYAFKFIASIRLVLLNEFSCKILMYLVYAPQALSAWFEAVVSVDRALSVALPNRFKIKDNRRFQWGVTMAIIAIQFGYYSPLLAAFKLRPLSTDTGNGSTTVVTSYTCWPTDEEFNLLGWMDLFNSTMFPFFWMIVSTFFIIKHLAGSRRRIHQSGGIIKPALMPSTSEPGDPSADRKPSAFQNGGARQVSKAILKKREQKDFSFALTSFVINFLFFILNIGTVTYNLLITYVEIPADDYVLATSLVQNIFFLDFMSKFFIYISVNSKFRSELRERFRLLKRPKRNLSGEHLIWDVL